VYGAVVGGTTGLESEVDEVVGDTVIRGC